MKTRTRTVRSSGRRAATVLATLLVAVVTLLGVAPASQAATKYPETMRICDVGKAGAKVCVDVTYRYKTKSVVETGTFTALRFSGKVTKLEKTKVQIKASSGKVLKTVYGPTLPMNGPAAPKTWHITAPRSSGLVLTANASVPGLGSLNDWPFYAGGFLN